MSIWSAIKSTVSKIGSALKKVGPAIQYGQPLSGPTATTSAYTAPPTGAETISATTTTTTRRTGGRAAPAPAPEVIEPLPTAPTPTEVAKDIPSGYSGVISAAEPTTFKTIYSVTKERIRRDPSKTLQHLYQAGRMALTKKAEEAIKKEEEAPVGKIVEKAEEEITGAVAGVYPLTRSERKYQKRVETFNEKSEELDKDIQAYNEKYGDKKLSQKDYDQAIVEEKKLSARVERREVVAEGLGKKGEELKAESKKFTPEVISRAASLGVVGAATFIPKFATAPGKTIAETVVSLQELPEQLTEAPVPTIAGIVGSLAAFYVGGKIVGRVVKGKPVDPVKLNTAIKGAEVKIKSTKGVTTETQLKTYRLPAEQKAELAGEINLGRSVRVTEYDITHINPASRKIINRAFPNRKITSIEVVDTAGNVISRKTLVGVEIKKGMIEYKDYTTGQGAGIYDPKARVAEVETTYIRGKPGKPATEIFKEKEVIKITEPKYVRTPTGEIMRGVEAKAKVFEGAKKVSTIQEPITFESLQKVIEAEKFGRYPVRTVKVREIQTLKELKLTEAHIQLDAKKIAALVGKEKKFVVEKGVGKAERIPEPIEFEYPRAMKSFEEVPEVKPGKPARIPKAEQILEKPVDVTQLPAADMTPQIIKGIEESAKEIVKLKPKDIAAIELSGQKLEAAVQKAWESQGVISPQLQRQLEKQIEKEKQVRAQRVTPVQMIMPAQAVAPKIAQRPMLTQKQLQKLVQPTQIIMPRIQLPKLDIPKVPGPIIPIPVIPKRPRGVQKEFEKMRKAQKKKFGYAASLAAAAAQREPLKITKKMYEKLKKKIYLGTEARPVLEIVPEEEIKKSAKEEVKF